MAALVFLTASEMARGIREKQFSALELVEAHLAQIERHNAQINAVVTLDAEGARGRANEADAALARGELWGPLHGVPVTFKDSWETAGMRTTSSSPRLKDYLPPRDATVVARIKAAGAIVLGKTNMPELAMDVQSNSPVFGPAGNPWDPARTPGGSTGGGAAAVAAGFAALEVGSDLGGSIRIPAHFCGVFGLKATNRRIPATGHIPPMPEGKGQSGLLGGMLSIGPLARSVEDLQLALGLLAGPDGKHLDIPPVPFQPTVEKDWRELRVAWCDELGIPVCGEIRAKIARLVSDLEQRGCAVEAARPNDLLLRDAMETYGELLGAGLAASGAKIPLPNGILRMLSKGEKIDMSRGYLFGMGAGLEDYARFLARQEGLLRSVEGFLAKYDAWILPVTASPAFPRIPFKNNSEARGVDIDVDGLPVNYFPANSGYVTAFNVTGHPVVVIPLGQTKAGLPVGAQIIGKRWSEASLLALAGKISREITGPFCPPAGY